MVDNRPPMLDKSQYNSWQSRMKLYIRGKEQGKDLIDSVLNGLFQNGTVEVPATPTTIAYMRERTYEDLTRKENIHEECDIRATNIVLQGLHPDVYNLVNHHTCMTRSSTSELFTPYKEPKREFQSSRKYFKTLSLNESRSPDFNLISDQEDSEEEVAKTMRKLWSSTCGQFLKELRTNTFSGLDHEDVNEHIEKVLEIVDLFHIPNITTGQVMLRAFPMSLTGAASCWLRNEPTGSITT
ncbi:hypothetical protein Tco_0085995 [Tanacetum coccineum]